MSELLHQLVAAQARKSPDLPAIVSRDQRVSYGALDATASRLAHLLAARGLAPGDRAALLMPKTPLALTAILGVLKAGAIYVPLDPGSPAPRLARMVASAEPRWILAGGPVGPLLESLLAEPGLGPVPAVGWLTPEVAPPVSPGFGWPDVEAAPAVAPAVVRLPEEPAHILFTSGSTGVPKGVMVTHAAVWHFVRWAADYFGTATGDRVSGHPPLHFDLSTFDIFGTLAAGATLHLVPPDLSLVPGELAGFIRDQELTQWFSVPSVLNYLAQFDAVRPGDFPSLKRVLWCGEVLPTSALIYWMRRVPHASYTNLYGPTEATIASSYYTVPSCPTDPTEPIPIGSPCRGEQLLVLDEALRQVPPGEVGQIAICGVGLSPGYWRDEAKTRAAFVPNPRAGDAGDRLYLTGDLGRMGADGLLRFLGRADTQIKSRGYRIELGEIETALAALDGLHECAVVAVDRGGFEGAVICAGYVLGEGVVLEPPALRRALARVLPGYMLPARWRAWDALPRNPNGKIDRPALRAAFAQELTRQTQ